MEQYQIPQFIEVEDKIIGPLTLKQFLWLLGGAATLFTVWAFTDIGFFIVLAGPVTVLFAAFAFYKINGRSFLFFIITLFLYFFSPKFFLWKRLPEIKDIKTEKLKKVISKKTPQKKLTESKITRLATILDRGEIEYAPTKEEQT